MNSKLKIGLLVAVLSLSFNSKGEAYPAQQDITKAFKPSLIHVIPKAHNHTNLTPKAPEKERKAVIKAIATPKDYTEITVEATAYVSFCDTGCIGITATGTNVQNDIYHDSGKRIVAVDPNLIPLGSTVVIEGETFIADDTGGDIKGHRIDILISVYDTNKAFAFGRKDLTIKVYK